MLPAPIQAVALLQEWEARAQPNPAAYAAQRPRLLAGFTTFCAALTHQPGVNVDLEDLRTVLKPATSLGIATAAAGGHNRAAIAGRLLMTALAEHVHPAPPTGPAHAGLLTISSPDEAELEMDELLEIVQTVQHHLGPDAEMIFGHGQHHAADGAGLRLWLLVGYA